MTRQALLVIYQNTMNVWLSRPFLDDLCGTPLQAGEKHSLRRENPHNQFITRKDKIQCVVGPDFLYRKGTHMSGITSNSVITALGSGSHNVSRRQTRKRAEVPPAPVTERHADPVEAVRQLAQQMVGQRLPSERDLAAHLQISRPYLRSILALLQKEGLVEARPKSGTYVVDGRSDRLHRIVLLIDGDLKLGDDPFIVSFVDRLQRSIQEAGGRCLIERTDGQSHRPSLEDGVLTLGLAGHTLITGQRTDSPPMVGLLLDGQTRPNHRASIFQLEDREAGRTAAGILLGRGCRELVFLGRRDIPASRERLEGVEEAAGENGAFFRYIGCHLNYGEGLRLGREIDLGVERSPLGIVANNDWLALGFRTGLRDRAVPAQREVPIVSFDGLPVTADPTLDITSLAVPIHEIAADAVAELQRLQRSQGATGRVIRYALR